ncbi:scarecrow-like protein 14 [Brachypodium distachyon]|nr:scarecrow-like protein 14 [Brachypodium distachyon]|eukprot:XP_003575608.4 scarecrow-like protein 14 [Brachypodium distachyon]
MLMEDDIVDKFSYQYPDHRKLLQTEKPFAQILSAAATISSRAQESSAPLAPTLMPSQDNNMDIMVSGFFSCEVQDPAFLNGTYVVESNSTLFPSDSSSSMDTNVAFFKGMQEANMFLPRDNGTGMVDGRGRKNRLEIDGEAEAGMGRSSKQIAVLVHSESEEDTTLKKRLDCLILNGYDRYPGEMQEVLITLDRENKAAEKSIRMRGRRGVKQTVETDLETLLIRCAEAVASNDRCSASELLEQIKRNSSPRGNARQRLAHYFSQGLEARLAGTGSQSYRSLIGTGISTVDLIKAYHLYSATCCFVKVAFLFSNKTIYNAVAGKKKLHIVHYGINTGVQWPDLIRWLADREGGPPEMRMTSINIPQAGFRPSEQIEAGHRLRNYASRLGVPFKFHAIETKPEAVQAEDLHIDPDEVLVVNSIFQFRTLMDDSLTFDRVNPRDMVLNTIRKMKPSVFVHAVTNGPYSAAFFMTRFRHALYNFMVSFDVMETMVPRDNDMRLQVERDIFARCAMNMIACEGTDRVERPQNYREWQTRIQRAGLRQLPLDPDIVLMLKDKVKNQYHKHFMINEDHRWLLQGWKGRVLYALSTWVAEDTTSSEVT